jgi:hypothetical protein
MSPIPPADDASDEFIEYMSPPEDLYEDEEEDLSILSDDYQGSSNYFMRDGAKWSEELQEDEEEEYESSGVEGTQSSEDLSRMSTFAEPTKSQPELNFEDFEMAVKKAMGVKKIPKGTKEQVWNGQIRDWKKALDGRLYHRKTNMVCVWAKEKLRCVINICALFSTKK